MFDNWREMTVEEIRANVPNALSTGPFGSAISARFFQQSGVPVLRGSNLSTDVGVRLIDEVLVFVSEEKAEEFSRSIARPGDLVFTCWGTIDQVGLIDSRSEYEEYVVSNKQMKFTADPEVADSLFLYYLFSGPQMKSQILNEGIGSSVPGFNLGQLRRIRFRLPPLFEQQAIAHVLGTLDDKIELNRRMNQTLEEIARALFRSWFVDFDPVWAKGDGRRPKGMDAETAALFPDLFIDTDDVMPLVPVGWEVQSLDQIANYLNGLALQKYPVEGDDWLPAIKIAQLRKGDSTGADRVGAHVPVEYQVDDGDVLFSWSGSLEVDIWCGRRGALNQHLFKVTSARYPKWFYYFWTKHHLPHFREVAAGKATTMGHIQRHHLRDAEVLVPPQELLSKLDRVMSPLVEKVVANRLESRTLAQIRDALLPLLLSGELRIPDAERCVAEAGV